MYPPVKLSSYKLYTGIYVIPGRKPLVIAHGLFGHKGNWNSLTKAMHQKLKTKVYAVDLRNHGDSPRCERMSNWDMASDLELLINEVVLPATPGACFIKVISLIVSAPGVKSVDLLGHSMGGRVGTLLTLSKPQIINRFIIEDVTPRPYGHSTMAYVPKYIQSMLNLTLDSSKLSSFTAARRSANEQLMNDVQDDSTRSFLLTNLYEKDGEFRWKMNLEAIRDNVHFIVDFPKVPDVQYVGPVLVVAGAKSHYVKEKDKHVFENFFPNFSFVSIDGAGHWVHADKPVEFLKTVVKFLKYSCSSK